MIQSVCPVAARRIELDVSMQPSNLAAAWNKPACSRCRTRCEMCRTAQAGRFKVRDAMVNSVLISLVPGQA